MKFIDWHKEDGEAKIDAIVDITPDQLDMLVETTEDINGVDSTP